MVELTAALIEGFSGIFVGLGLAFYFSWPMTAVIFIVCPMILLGNKAGVKVR